MAIYRDVTVYKWPKWVPHLVAEDISTSELGSLVGGPATLSVWIRRVFGVSPIRHSRELIDTLRKVMKIRAKSYPWGSVLAWEARNTRYQIALAWNEAMNQLGYTVVDLDSGDWEPKDSWVKPEKQVLKVISHTPGSEGAGQHVVRDLEATTPDTWCHATGIGSWRPKGIRSRWDVVRKDGP